MSKERDVFTTIMLSLLVIQLSLVAFKLLDILHWSWLIILIPLEIYMGLGVISALIIVFYIVFVEKR